MLKNKDTMSFEVPRFKGIAALVLFLLLMVSAPLQVAQAIQDNESSLTSLAQQIVVDRSVEVMTISLDLHKMRLPEALVILTEEMGVELSYSSDTSLDKIVTVQMNDVPFHEALYALLEGTNLEPLLPPTKDVLVIREKEDVNEADIFQETVRGQVVDAQTGEALPGVNIVIEGTSTGTATDTDGTYELDVPSLQETLVFTYIGYERQEIDIAGRTELNIELIPQVLAGDELVVVGYGTQRRVNLTGSVSTVNFDEAMDNRPITNASQALGGKTSGVWVSQTSGRPGDDGAQLRIRGWGTLSDASPLVIIDGIEGNINQVNPNDIESISVLKDAASAAIYGSKAANGVVLITTKEGGLQESMSINLSTYTGVQSLGRRFDIINDSAELMEMVNRAHESVGGTNRYPEYLITEFRNSDDPFKYPNTDWYEHLFRNSLIHEHNISMSGGSEQTSVYLSFNYLDQEGMIQNSNSNRFGIRANVESLINERITIGGRLNFINQKSETPYSEFRNFGSMSRVYNMFRTSAPFIAPYTRDGRLGGVQAIDRDGVILAENNNPLIDANNGLTSIDRNIINVNAYTNIGLTNNLNWRTTVASSGQWSTIDNHNEPVFGYTDTGVARTSRNLNREGIEVMRDLNQNVDRRAYTTLNFSDNFNQHEISFVTGLQIEDLSIKNMFSRRSDPAKTGLTQVDAGTGGVVAEGNLNRLRMFSYFGRFNYSYDSKYLFEANFRADASSRFKEGNRWGYFPGFSAGWRLIEEDFASNWNIFSDLKIRGSWGKLGNQNIAGFWPYLPIINQTNSLSYNYGGTFAPGAAITEMVDEDITWETTTSFDFGIEAGFFENKLNIQADYFNKITEGILVRLPTPNTLGSINPPIENIGEMTNEGFELSIAYTNWASSRDDLSYSVEVNLTSQNNEVTKFRGGDSPDQLFLIREGFSFQTLYGFKVEGIYQTDQEAAEHMHSSGFTPRAGDLRYEDVNNDGQLGFEDGQELGNTIPNYLFGINPNISYKGFNLNATLQGAAGVYYWNQSAITTTSGDGVNVISTKWRDAWSPQNTDTDVPALRVDYTWNQQQSSYWVEEISFIKLKNIQLGYSLPPNLTSMLNMKRLHIYANAQNVGSLIFGDYDGYDPERSTFNSGDNFYPLPRIVSLGVNVEL